MLFLLLLLAHLIGDFPLQTDRMVELKATKPWFRSSLPLHTLIHLILAILFSVPYGIAHHQWVVALAMSVILAILHLMIDACKVAVDAAISKHGSLGLLLDVVVVKVSNSKIEKANPAGDPRVKPAAQELRVTKLMLFILDQLMHILAILAVLLIFEPHAVASLEAFTMKIVHGQNPDLTILARVLTIFIVGLYATVVSSVVVQILTYPAPANTESTLEPDPQVPRGRLIGYLERLIVVTIVCIGAYTVIPLIVAAKSLARFKKFDNQEWAEYFLVGTLSSILCGTLSGLLLRVLLHIQS
ncbi:MAG: hypothetical protein A2201_08540 [Alicyclobacillus sp. RIFOXYA1_FULL_53_8]|nr:MAG: hypothetical protein A2201_08540 [Alicyclobacillus sp. RIFOXYA1_FULL_53_8]